MPTLFKYQPQITSGPNGTKIVFENDDNYSATPIAAIDNWHYVSVPDGVTMPAQPPEINWQSVTADAALIEALKRSRPVQIHKDQVRKKIESEVGDIYDLVSDCMRLCEFAIALSLRVGSEVLTGTQMPEPTRTIYTGRVQAVLAAMESGQIMLRGDIKDPDEMMTRLMTRYSKISELLASDYKPQVDALLP